MIPVKISGLFRKNFYYLDHLSGAGKRTAEDCLSNQTGSCYTGIPLVFAFDYGQSFYYNIN